MSELLVDGLFWHGSWVETSSASFHSLILLQIEAIGKRKHYLFNFNHTWLKEWYFINLVKNESEVLPEVEDTSTM